MQDNLHGDSTLEQQWSQGITSLVIHPANISLSITPFISDNWFQLSYKSLREDVMSRVAADPDVGITAWYRQLRDSY